MKKINKRNKYVGGGMTPYMKTDFNSQLPTKLSAPQEVAAFAPGNMKPTSSANFLQSSKFASLMGGSGGSGGMGAIGQVGDAVTSMIGNMTGPATASTVSESRKQTAMGTIQGTFKGASAGFAIGGPVGGIIGGAIGLASGITGKKGSVTTSSDMYDDQVDIKYGTGIRGGRRNRRKLHDKADQYRSVARSNQASLAMGQQNIQDFYEDYDTDIQTMAQGGMTSSLAYVDDGELLNLPQGNILEVPEEGKPTDSNLVDLPEGTRILSDKRKVPGSKETFAQMGKRLMSKKRTTRKDKYAENAAMLNEMNDQIIYDKLFAIQEATKVNKKTKNGIQAAAGGDIITASNNGRYTKVADKLYRPWNYWKDVYDSTRYTPGKYNTTNTPTAVSNNLNQNNKIERTHVYRDGEWWYSVPGKTYMVGPGDEEYVLPTPEFIKNEFTNGYRYDEILPEWRNQNKHFQDNSLNREIWPSTPVSRPKQQNTSSKTVNTNTPVTTTAYSNVSVTPSKRSTSTTNSTAKPVAKSAVKQPVTRSIEPVANELDLSNETPARVGDERAPYMEYTPSVTSNISTTNTNSNRPNSKIDWGGALGDIFTDFAALSPTISNLFTKPETFTAQYNPYEGHVRNIMANRKFDISPAKRAIRENRAMGNYNAANYNPNTGSNLAYRIQSQIASDKAISDLYSTASNVNNQYKGEYANTLNSLGQQRVNAKNLAVYMNAKSRSAARNIQRTALSQLSQFGQNKQFMRNQKARDMAMLDAFSPLLQSVYKTVDYSKLIKKLTR